MSKEKKKLPYEDEFVKWLEEERQVKPITIESYLNSLGVISQNLPIPLHEITPETLRDYIDVRRDDNTSDSTIAKELRVIKVYFMFLWVSERVDELTYFKVKNFKFKGDFSRLPKVITKEQVRAMFEQIDPGGHTGIRDALIMFLLYRAGLRAEEARLLDVEHVTTRDGQIWLPTSITKYSKEAYVPIDGENFKKILNIYLKKVRPKWAIEGENALLIGMHHINSGRRMTQEGIRQRVKKLAEKAGLPSWVACHALRHSRATHLLDDGTDLRIIQELLRHSDISVTQIYTQVSKELLMKQLKKHAPEEEPIEDLLKY